MRMEKRKFRIGELAKHLYVEHFVIRFWEKEFDLKPTRSSGGQRFYTQEDVHTFQKIKELLYTKGYTIPGARKQLHISHKSTQINQPVIGSHKTTLASTSSSKKILDKKLTYLQKKLLHLQKLL